MSLLAEYNAERSARGVTSEETKRRLASLCATAPDVLRDQLRAAMRHCPACVPDNADEVEDADLVPWLLSHGVEPVTEPTACACPHPPACHDDIGFCTVDDCGCMAGPRQRAS